MHKHDTQRTHATQHNETKHQGVRRHALTLINPVNEKALRFTSTEASDYPCSNMKELETLVGVTKEVVKGLLPAGGDDDAALRVKRIDEGGLDGDLCCIVSAPAAGITAVVWPTVEKLKLLKQLASDAAVQQLLIVNPQWRAEGNLVSEFGLLPWDRKANEEFVATFEATYALSEQRVGAPSSINMASGRRYDSGAVVRLLRVWPGQYAVHVMAADGASQAIGGFDTKPAYRQLEALIADARAAKLEIFDVAKAASSLDLEMGKSRSSGDDGDEAASAEALAAAFPSLKELKAMEADPKAVRRLVVSLGLPGSGTPAKLQARAVAVAEALAAGQSLEAAVAVARKLR